MGTELATQKTGRRATLQAYLSDKHFLNQLAMALPRSIPPEMIARVCLTATVKNRKLLECTPESVCLELLRCAELGLIPDGREASLVPFYNKKTKTTVCQLIPGFLGLVQLAYRSGSINGFTAMAVYESDDFRYEFGSHEYIRHIPSEDADPGPLKYAWAMVRFKDGGSKFVVLNKRQVLKRKASSQTADRSDMPWSTHPEEMWAKSAAKALAKWIPQTPELARFHAAVDKDNEVEYGEPLRLDISGTTTTTSINAALAAMEMPAIQGDVETDGELLMGSINPSDFPTDPRSDTTRQREDYLTAIEGFDAIGEVTSMIKRASSDELLTAEDKELVIAAANRQAATIRGRRGAKSNGGKMFDSQESATEAGM